MKLAIFLGDARNTIGAFPELARREAGFQLDRVQNGKDPDDWKPLGIVGPGVREIRIREPGGAFRVVYYAHFEEAVYVLHAFRKKTQKTAKRDLELAASRYAQLMVHR
ncbi:MAG: type II toxin-antitoxin system RelE/ParE family toxin [Rhizomicrobium sp.]